MLFVRSWHRDFCESATISRSGSGRNASESALQRCDEEIRRSKKGY